jgi:septal ring factor EnvC (AmiA/AmiB activator)
MFRATFLGIALLSLVGCASTTANNNPAAPGSQTQLTSANVAQKSPEEEKRADSLINEIASAIETKAAEKAAADKAAADKAAADQQKASEQKVAADEAKAAEQKSAEMPAKNKRGKKGPMVPVKLDQKSTSGAKKKGK